MSDDISDYVLDGRFEVTYYEKHIDCFWAPCDECEAEKEAEKAWMGIPKVTGKRLPRKVTSK
jgi:hypothetical protein